MEALSAARFCIFWGDGYTTTNTLWGEVYGPTTLQAYDSCLEDFLAAAFTTSGVIDTDPLFVAGTARRLSSTSPCIDTGSTTLPDDRFDLDGDLSTTDDLPIDYFGDPRSVDGDADTAAVPDMGIHEYQVCAMSLPRPRPRHKFSAKRTERDGQSFDSKLEARLFDQLELQKRAGEVVFFLRQVPIHLPGGVKLVVDFQVLRTATFASSTRRASRPSSSAPSGASSRRSTPSRSRRGRDDPRGRVAVTVY